ncbi:MAG: cytochrome b [Rhodobacteraceae bacterium]|nr:cytochrome b [Paracoccaceae bacterium]
MPARSLTGYDPVARTFHWLGVLLVLSAVLVGLRMTRLPMESDADFAAAMKVFSIHKTIGVAAFLTALLRILWAVLRPRPGPLHPQRRVETFLAALVHWSLYGALLVMPLSGWIYSSANPGYAPILLPVPQVLPFVPATEAASNIWKSVHHVAAWVLYAAVALHVAGAFKHAILDMDATLARMTTGRGPAVPAARFRPLPALLALALWAATLAAGILAAPAPEPDPFQDIGTLEEAAPLD